MVVTLANRIYAQRLNYGPRAGINFSFIKGLDKLPLPKRSTQGSVFDIMRTAFHVGAYSEYAFTSKLSLGMELFYGRVGSIYEKIALRLSYVHIPAWLMFCPWGHQQGIGVYAGPSLNFLWHAASENLSLFNIKERHVDPFEWAIVSGGRYLFDFGLWIDLRYNWGLTDIFDFQPASQRPRQLDNVGLTNHCLQLSLGYNLARLVQDNDKEH